MFRRLIAYVLVIGAVSACAAEDGPGGPITEPDRTFSGVWLYEFEGSTFLEGADDVPNSKVSRHDAAWLKLHPREIDPGRLHPTIIDPTQDYDRYDEEQDCYPKFAFAISFEGAETTYSEKPLNLPGAGHLGLWGSDITVDRIISVQPLSGGFC